MHPKDGDTEECPDDIWDLTMQINVKGVWYGSKHAIRSLRKHGKTKGSIINTASRVAIVGSATPQVAYTASKGAVLALTRELAIVHARERYRFNSLCPAPLKYVYTNLGLGMCKLIVPSALQCSKSSWEMTSRGDFVVKYTFLLAVLGKQSSKPRLLCF